VELTGAGPIAQASHVDVTTIFGRAKIRHDLSARGGMRDQSIAW
jgi:hypothetical protein